MFLTIPLPAAEILAFSLIPATFQIFIVVSLEHDITIQKLLLVGNFLTHLSALIEYYLIHPVSMFIKICKQSCLNADDQ